MRQRTHTPLISIFTLALALCGINVWISHLFAGNLPIISLASLSCTLVFTYFFIQIYKKNTRLLETFSEVSNIAKVGFWEMDVDDQKVDCSQGLIDILGCENGSIKTFDKLISYLADDQRELLKAQFEMTIKEKRDYHLVHVVETEDQHVKYIESKVRHYFDAFGKHKQSIGIVFDITDRKTDHDRLRESSLRWKYALECNGDGLWDWNIQTNEVFFSRGWKKMLGFNEDEIENALSEWEKRVHPEHLPNVYKDINNYFEGITPQYRSEHLVQCKDGSYKWVLDRGMIVEYDEAGKPKRMVGTHTDIDLQKSTMDKIEKILDMQENIVILTDGKEIQYANHKFLSFFGVETLEAFTEDHKHFEDMFISFESYFDKKKIQAHHRHWVDALLALSGRERIVSMLGYTVVPTAFSVSINQFNSDNYIINFSDISDNMIEKVALEKEVMIDRLTGAYNRNYFENQIHHLVSSHRNEGRKTGIIYYDIDHFKQINDNFGHDVGDVVLHAITSLVKRHIRESDKLIRIGGEEFLLIASVNSDDDLLLLAEKLRMCIQDEPFYKVEHITCSFGCAVRLVDEKIAKTIKRADLNLYEAKGTGRNRVCINQECLEEIC